MQDIFWRLPLIIASSGLLAHITGDEKTASPLFNTQFLSNPDAVADFLVEKGFDKITIQSENLSLEGFFLNRAGNKTVIAIAGFLPGKITGMATLYELLPESYNILLINLRGKGNSDGRLALLRLWRYGVDEYKDVCAAIQFAHEKAPQAKIIIHGICAGGFHAMKALAHLHDSNHSLYSTVEHAIIDSSFPSIEETGRTALCAEIEKQCRPLPLGSIIAQPLKLFYLCLNYSIISPLMRLNSDEITITREMIRKASHNCKFVFIHGIRDSYAPIEKIQALIAHMDSGKYSVHYFDTHSHASLHLKFKNVYKEILAGIVSLRTLYSNYHAKRVLELKFSR